MRNRIAVLAVAIILAVALLAVPAGDASRPPGPRAHCGKLHRVTEVRKLARRAWRQPLGPTKKQKANYRRYLRCPRKTTRGRMKIEWHRAETRLKEVRYLGRLRDRCGTSEVEVCVVYAALVYDQDVSKAVAVGTAESGLRACPPENPTHHGTFQFDDATWAESPYAAHDPCQPLWNSLAAMWYWANGAYSRWVTY